MFSKDCVFEKRLSSNGTREKFLVLHLKTSRPCAEFNECDYSVPLNVRKRGLRKG
jgi:hypothetical protein